MQPLRRLLGERRLALGTVTLTTTLTTVLLAATLTTMAPSALSARSVPNPLAPSHDSAMARVKLPPLLSVQNDNWLDVHVYAVRDGEPYSLGVVTGPGETVFDLPAMMTTPGARVQILALPIGGTADYLSPEIDINPGDVVKLSIANALPLSNVIVEPGSRIQKK